MSGEDTLPAPIRSSSAETDRGAESEFDPRPDCETGESSESSIVLRSGDDVDRTISVSIARPGGRRTGGDCRLASGRARSVVLVDPGGVLRFEIDTGTGATACVSLDPAEKGSDPEFLVRDDRVSVSGLAAPSERAFGTDTSDGV
jgi:hypothetical protein